MPGWKGSQVRVNITSGKTGAVQPMSAESVLCEKVRATMIGREVIDVIYAEDQVVFKLNDGGSVSINCAGGLKEVN